MNSFLKETRKLLQLKEPLLIITGNDSCDLDSAITTICLSLFYHQNRPAAHPSDLKIMPMLNIPREHLPLKTEVTWYFRQQNVELDSLICRDEICPTQLNTSKFILVDHHYSKFNRQTIEVIDHRPFDKNSQLPEACLTKIVEVGSCATLIADLIMKSSPNVEANLEILQLLYGPIVLDTVNFSVEADKVRPLDVAVCSDLERLLGYSLAYRNKLFTDLVSARADVSSLNSLQILSKDLKIISDENSKNIVAIPGYPILVQDYVQLADAQENLRKFSQLNNLDVIVLMGMKVTADNRVQRGLGIINFKNSELFNKIIDNLSATTTPNLQLEQIDGIDLLQGKFYKQLNIKASRKQILPMIKTILDTQ